MRNESASATAGGAPRREAIDHCAERILEVIPRAIHGIRREMRSGTAHRLTVPQMRALLYVQRHPGTSLGDVAAHLGISPSTGSALVDRLVRQDLVERTIDPMERRRIRLTSTPTGTALVGSARETTRAWLRESLSTLDDRDIAGLVRAMDMLEAVTTAAPDAGSVGAP